MRGFAAAVLGLGMLLAGSATAQQPTPDKRFDATYAAIAKGIDGGTFSYHFNQTGTAYSVTAQRRLTGFFRMLAGDRQDFNYSASGGVDAGTLRPVHYQHSGGSRHRVVRAVFSADDIVTTAEPHMGMGHPPATQAQKRGAVDQLTAIARLITATPTPCAGTVPVYMDGRSRFDFVLTPNGQVNVNTPIYRGPAVRCAVQFRPIAGFSDPQEAQSLTFVFAPTPSGLFAPLSIEMPSDDLGVIRLEARSISVNGVALHR
ncbi:MAG TPA: DUF3108 domain-containing protein [Vitreimonas sp.]|jgi:hypothetical protein|nr:DUF3108 domain-containing protein [Vitreimonas sp.]